MQVCIAQPLNVHSNLRHCFTSQLAAAWSTIEHYACYLCRSAVDPYDSAQDLLQNTIITAWEHFLELKDYRRFKHWLCRIMRSLHLQKRRTDIRRSTVVIRSSVNEEEGIYSVTSVASSIQNSLDVRHALVTLHEMDRQAVLLALGGIEISELSALQRCSKDCMKKRLERARRKMRQHLEDGSDWRISFPMHGDVTYSVSYLVDQVSKNAQRPA